MAIKLSRYCSGVIEAVWLATVCIIPLFFNVYSSRIFEPDKIAILRSFALLSLAAWLIKLLIDGVSRWKENSDESSLAGYLLHFPMLLPVIGLVLVYLISTLFSVSPSISFLGSYQRLQGTYTTFSYLVIFLSIIGNMRSKEQVDRIITAIIFTSLPICLYGFLQHYKIDPIPWAGDVSIRIASTMGNSIFVAAYLIMVFPLTVGRMVSALRKILSDDNGLSSSTTSYRQVIKATLYVFIAAVELIAIYMSQSRGPMLGLLAGIYLFLLLLSIYWNKRWFTVLIVALAIVGVGFLAIFNINNGPLDALKKSPTIGRFGRLLDPESNSALVRQYIWDGTVNLVGIHQPLKFPDGSSDKFNFLRPLLGYGPESMYVAYNQFYQPELGQVEKRNASPDRAHNETWDSIVITGGAGLIVYLSIFGSFFYFGLKWLGLISNKRDKYLLLGCLIGGGILGAIILVVIKGIEFFGVGLPLGMIFGLVFYLTIYALFFPNHSRIESLSNPFAPLIILLFAAVVGHFVEINFGIAIVATRTLFWTYTGILVVVGYILPRSEGFRDEEIRQSDSSPAISISSGRKRGIKTSPKQRQKAERSGRPLFGDQPDWVRNSLINAFLVGIILVTMGFNFITNAGHSKSFLIIIIDSLTRLPNHDNIFLPSIFGLIFITWIVGIFLFSVENDTLHDNSEILKSLGITTLISFVIGLVFWILHALSLGILAGFSPEYLNDVVQQVNSLGSLLTKYYIYILLLILLFSILLPREWPQRSSSKETLPLVLAPFALVLVLFLGFTSNIRVIQADITFKMADPFTKSGQWQVATFLYKRALELAPKEDHYYLFLGRSYLEQAKITEATSDQDSLVLQAEQDLTTAQSINPLNTDHTANLARLYSWWAGKATNNQDIQSRGQKASDYYSKAITLSPNNSTLWDEWAVLFMQVLGQSQEALLRLQHALSLDDQYSFTQGLFGDFYVKAANAADDINTKIQALNTAAKYYDTAAKVYKKGDTTSKASYLVSLGNVNIILDNLGQTGGDHTQLRQAADVLVQSLDSGLTDSDTWRVQEIIAKIYLQLGDKSMAQYYAGEALMNAPSTVTSRIQTMVDQINSLP